MARAIPRRSARHSDVRYDGQPGPRCVFERLGAKADELAKELRARGVPYPAIAEALTAQFKTWVGHYSVGEHLRERCRCVRATQPERVR